MGSFLTRLPDLFPQIGLITICLAFCSACVTPFPLDELEVGMTMTQATQAFGEPSSTSLTELQEAVQLLEQEKARIYERLGTAVDLSEMRGLAAQELEASSTQATLSLHGFVTELGAAHDEAGVRSTWTYPHEAQIRGSWVVYLASIPLFGFPLIAGAHIEQQLADLHFEGGALVSWTTRIAPVAPVMGTYGYYPSPFYQSPFYQSPFYDAKGHKHHHGHKSHKGQRLGGGHKGNRKHK